MERMVLLFLVFLALFSCSRDEKTRNLNTLITFSFRAEDNKDLQEDITASIDRQEKTVTIQLPYDIDLTALKPSITISEDATVAPGNKKAVDFSKPVHYVVTAADGSKATYPITISFIPNDRKVLMDILSANPESGLNWNFDDNGMFNLEEVTLRNGRVTSLRFYPKKLLQGSGY